MSQTSNVKDCPSLSHVSFLDIVGIEDAGLFENAERDTYPAAPVTIAFFPSRRPMLNMLESHCWKYAGYSCGIRVLARC